MGEKPAGNVVDAVGAGPVVTGGGVTDATADGVAGAVDAADVAGAAGPADPEVTAAAGGADDGGGEVGGPGLALEWLLEQPLANTTVANARTAAGVVQVRVM